MAFQLIALGVLAFGAYQAFNRSEFNRKNYMLMTQVTPITPSAFVGYDEPSNTWVDPLNVTFNRKHLPIERTEVGTYGVPRVMYISEYGHTSHPLYGHGIEKI